MDALCKCPIYMVIRNFAQMHSNQTVTQIERFIAQLSANQAIRSLVFFNAGTKCWLFKIIVLLTISIVLFYVFSYSTPLSKIPLKGFPNLVSCYIFVADIFLCKS